MKDNQTLSKGERDHEREVEQHALEDARHSRSRPTAARAVQRVKSIRLSKGLSGGGRGGKTNTKYPSRAAPQGAPAKEFARRAFVRTRWVASKKLGHWAAHARYLERDGAQVEGQQGVGFGGTEDAVDMSKEAGRWQREGDDKIYKMVLSPEDGDRLDLVAYTRAIMADMQKQTGKEFEWVAIDHHNTDNPHVHILIRGKDLELDRELVKSGIRTMAEDHATRSLGYKSEQEKRAELNHDIKARRFTQLDRLIQQKGQDAQDGSGIVVTESGLSRVTNRGTNQAAIDLRTKRIARLQMLEELGVAEKVGSMTWKLDNNWAAALKQLEIMRTRSTMLIQHRELMTDPRALPVVTKIKPGESIIGRSLGGGIDETTDKPYLLVEGMDGRAHFIARSDHADPIKPGKLIAIQGYTSKTGVASMNVLEYDLVIPASGFGKVMTGAGSAEVAKAAEDELARREKTGQPLPGTISPSVGFAAAMQRALLQHQTTREKEKLEKEQQKVQQSEKAKPRGMSMD